MVRALFEAFRCIICSIYLFTFTDWVKPAARYCCASHFPQPEAKGPVKEQEKQVAEGSRAVGHGPGAGPLRQAHQ